MLGGHPALMGRVSVRRILPAARAARGIERTRAHAPAGLLVTGALLFAAVATLAVVLLRAH
jgi:hypothetical protein